MAQVKTMGSGVICTPQLTVDTLGLMCPLPVAKTRSVLITMHKDEILEVWSDDPESLHDIPALCNRHNAVLLSVEGEAGEFRFLIRSGGRADG